MDLTEKCLESREVYKGRVLRLRVDTVALPNGKTSLREVVEHPGGVGSWPWTKTAAFPW